MFFTYLSSVLKLQKLRKDITMRVSTHWSGSWLQPPKKKLLGYYWGIISQVAMVHRQRLKQLEANCYAYGSSSQVSRRWYHVMLMWEKANHNGNFCRLLTGELWIDTITIPKKRFITGHIRILM
jgi:hypothetical protein